MRELYGRGVAAVAPAEHADHDQGAQPAPDATEAELEARGMYEAARGTTAEGVDVPMQAPAHPEGAPQRPARQRRPGTDTDDAGEGDRPFQPNRPITYVNVPSALSVKQFFLGWPAVGAQVLAGRYG